MSDYNENNKGGWFTKDMGSGWKMTIHESEIGDFIRGYIQGIRIGAVIFIIIIATLGILYYNASKDSPYNGKWETVSDKEFKEYMKANPQDWAGWAKYKSQREEQMNKKR